MRPSMNRLLALVTLAAFTVCSGCACARAPKTQAPGLSKTAGSKLPDKDKVCYPESMSEEDKQLNLTVPCASSQFVHVPLKRVQKFTKHDEQGIWADKEVWTPGGASIWEGTTKLDGTVVTISQVVGAMCSPSDCPVRVRFQKTGEKDVFVGWPEMPKVCASGNYFFISKDKTELLACGKTFSLRTGKEGPR